MTPERGRSSRAVEPLLPDLVGNPLLARYGELADQQGASGDERRSLVGRYSFAIPTDEALAAIAAVSPRGVVDLGAGTGYWARLLNDNGVDVVAYDLVPPPSTDSQWFAGVTPWYPVAEAGDEVVEHHADRTLLIVWPGRNDEWAARAVAAYQRVGGRSLAYVGEGPGGPTGDDQLHALLGHIEYCLACAYGLLETACTCARHQQWERRATIELPHWEGFSDDLHLYRPRHPTASRQPRARARAPSRRNLQSDRRPRRRR